MEHKLFTSDKNYLLKEAQFSRPIYERLIRALWEKLEDINQIGSLLRLEQEVETLMPHDLVNAKLVSAVINEFFGSSRPFYLVQIWDRINESRCWWFRQLTRAHCNLIN